MATSNLTNKFFIEVKWAFEGEHQPFPMERVLEELQVNDAITGEEGDQIGQITSQEGQIKELLSILKRKPLSAYEAFSASMKDHAPDFHRRKLKPVEKYKSELHVKDTRKRPNIRPEDGSVTGRGATKVARVAQPGTEMLTNEDIQYAVWETRLLKDDFTRLFMKLKLDDSDVQNARGRAGTIDIKLQADQVLKFWCQRKGKKASRLALLEALYECDLVAAKEILEKKWHVQFRGKHYHYNNNGNGYCLFSVDAVPPVYKDDQHFEVGGLLYNIMRARIIKELTDVDLQKAKEVLRIDTSVKYGMDVSTLEEDTKTDWAMLFDSLENIRLLGPWNLVFLPLLLTWIQRAELQNIVDVFIERAEQYGINPLYLGYVKLCPLGMLPVEIRITCKREEPLNRSAIEKIRELLSKTLMIKLQDVRFETAAKGSIIVVFLLPEHVKENLKAAATKKELWLIEANVSGIHIKGEEYISLVDTAEEIVSDQDLLDVATRAKLSYEDLSSLYIILGISQSDVEDAESEADEDCVQAVNVLRVWRMQNGNQATRKVLLDAISMCGLLQAKQMLEEKWYIRATPSHDCDEGISVEGPHPQQQDQKQDVLFRTTVKAVEQGIASMTVSDSKLKVDDETSSTYSGDSGWLSFGDMATSPAARFSELEEFTVVVSNDRGHGWYSKEWIESLKSESADKSELRSSDHFVRLHAAIQYVCQQAIPCISDIIRSWHMQQVEILQPCQTPQQCMTGGKPKPGSSCTACVAWGNAIESVYYQPATKHGNYKFITWTNINPTLLHKDPLEVAKAFVLRLVPGKTYTTFGDFDSVCFITIMMRFSIFHGNDTSVYDKLQKMLEIRNTLAHMKVGDNFYLDKDKVEASFQVLNDLMQALIALHPTYFQNDMCQAIEKIKSSNVMATREEMEQKLNSDSPIEQKYALTQNVKHEDADTDEDHEDRMIDMLAHPRNWEEEKFDIIQCQQELRAFYRQHLCRVPLFPGFGRADSLNLDDVYANLSILITLPKPCNPIQIPVRSHNEIFLYRGDTGIPPSRILVLGDAGCGKSLLISKFAYDWAVQNHESPLKNVNLVFALNMRWMTPDTTVEDAIFQQLLKGTSLRKTALREYIWQNQSACVILFDSYDEHRYKPESEAHRIFANKILPECTVVVTSRFWKSQDFDDFQDFYTRIQITGFSEENVKAFVNKFFRDDTFAASGLLMFLADHNLNPGIASVPLMTLLFCLYWKESGGENMPSKMGDLFSKIFQMFYSQYQAKVLSDECIDVQKLVVDIGKVALAGLWPPNIKSLFDLKEFSADTVELGCKIGLLSIEQHSISNGGAVKFFHESCQEKCAGEYLANIYHTNPSDFAKKLQQLDSAHSCFSVGMVLRFACGTSCTVGFKILQKLVQIFESEFSPIAKEYYEESLEPDTTKTFQKFVDLCLQCYYECPDFTKSDLHVHEQLLRLLDGLFPHGQVLFLGMSPLLSKAMEQYILHSKRIKSVDVKAIPSPGDRGILSSGVIRKVWNLTLQTLVRLPKNLLQDLYEKYSNEGNMSDFENLWATEVANYFSDLQSSPGINLGPVFTSLAHCNELDTLKLINVKLGSQMSILQDVINQGALVMVTRLTLFNNGLDSEQVTNLLDSVQRQYLPRLVRLDISHNKARLTHLGDCLVNTQIQQLFVDDMGAPAEDMLDVITKLPQFGPRMTALRMDQNDFDDNAGNALATAFPCVSHLELFSISMDMMKRSTHNKVINAMLHLINLRVLLITASRYLDDLFRCLSSTMAHLPLLESVSLHSYHGTKDKSSKASASKLLPWMHSRREQTTVNRSSCQRFLTRLDTMANMQEITVSNISLHKEDLTCLIALCRQHNYRALGYSRNMFPESMDVPEDDFFLFY